MAQQSEKKLSPDVKVTILGQRHKTDNYDGSDKIKNEEISKSQFLILKEIEKNPNALVFLESHTEDYTPELLLNNKTIKLLSEIAKMFFPEGKIPEDYSQLTNMQKEFLREYGGALTAYFMGVIDTVHRSISPSNCKEIDLATKELISTGRLLKSSVPIDTLITRKDFTEEGEDVVFTQRENCLEQEVVQVANQPENKGKDVIVIYGAAHIETLKERYKANNPTIVDTTK